MDAQTDDNLTVDGVPYATKARADHARRMKALNEANGDDARQPDAEEEAANAAAAPKAPKAKRVAKERTALPPTKKPQKTAAKAAPAKKAPKAAAKAKAAPAPKPAAAAPASGNKGEIVIALLRRPDGATLLELQTATGWQAHSVRGFLAGALKKKGHVAVSTKEERGRVYRLPVEGASEEAIG